MTCLNIEGDSLQGLRKYLDSLADVVLENRLSLDYLLAEQGRYVQLRRKPAAVLAITLVRLR